MVEAQPQRTARGSEEVTEVTSPLLHRPRNVVEVHGAHAPTPDEAMFALQDWIQKITTPPEPEPEKCQAGLTLV